jgi:fibronectin type 3 domain-containing protein
MRAPKSVWILAVIIAVFLVALLAYRLVWAQHSGSKTAKPHSVTLSWDPSPGAASYNIYRGSASGGPYTEIGSSLTPEYEDSPVPSGVVLYYVVTTVKNNEESKYSSEIKAVVP